MRWLETPQNEAERLLREGLDLAIERRGDEITHRRVWAKMAETMEAPARRVRPAFVFACATAVVVAATGAVLLPRLTRVWGHHEGLTQRVAPPPAPGVPSSHEKATAGGDKLVESERLPGQIVRTRAGEHARVALGGGAEAEMRENSAITWDDQQRPSVLQGSALLTVPHQAPGWHFSVGAGPYVVTVIGTRFEVQVVNRTVGVEVKEGVVEVWRGSRSTRLVAGDSWNGPLYPDEAAGANTAPSERPQPAAVARASAAGSRTLQDAETALRNGDTNRAIAILERAAAGNGAAAENAAYELGRINRYQLNRPRQAVALWNQYRARFPGGLLRTEADLSIVETLASLGDGRAALEEAEAFLSRHPTSERRLEVQKLAERLRTADLTGTR